VNEPFLIDECLSLDLVALAHARGHHATHVTFRNLQGTADRELMPLVRTEGFVLVTNNGRDFRKLYSQEAIHPGLIIIVPGGIPAETQLRLFGLVLDAVEPMPDLMNKVVEISITGTVRIQDLPAP
jgi:predicted nuclease of predicted toxin-antitoxin system